MEIEVKPETKTIKVLKPKKK